MYLNHYLTRGKECFFFRRAHVAPVLTAYLVAFFAVAPVMAQQQQKNEGFSAKGVTPSNVTSLENPQEAIQQTLDGQAVRESGKSGAGQMGVGESELPMIKVHVLGEVLNPGIYNISISDRLSDVMSSATPKRASQRIVEVRHPGERTRVYDLYRYYFFGDLEQNPFLKDNDVLFLSPRKGAVRIEGPVARPGVYELSNEKKLSDIVRLAGGLTSAASRIHAIRIVRFSEEGKQFIVNVENTSSSLRAFKIHHGDIIVVPDIVNNPKKFDYTVETLPGENLFYPTSTPNVFVVGNVGQAGAFPYKSHLKVGDYVAYASPSPTAALGSVTRIRNGKRSRLGINEQPNPGDILVVKTRPNLAAVISLVSTGLTLTLTALLLRDQLRD